MLPSLSVLDSTTGTRTPELVVGRADVEAAEEAAPALVAELLSAELEAADSLVAVAEDTTVLPSELVVVSGTTVEGIELADEAAAEVSEEAADEDSVEGAAEEDATTDELRPDEEAPEDEEGEGDEETPELCALCTAEAEAELWAAEEESAEEEGDEEAVAEAEVCPEETGL